MLHEPTWFLCRPSGPGVEVVKGGHSIDHILTHSSTQRWSSSRHQESWAEGASNLEREKWDWALPPELLKKAYASLNLDIELAKKWVTSHFSEAWSFLQISSPEIEQPPHSGFQCNPVKTQSQSS